ncbi:helix-turn-helix domain-containing protein [Cohnella thailandensis]|uniref:AraC family transcriptional regulator n=1 Tax=Cohnella thailandensis TaxID=557557 RepID=A0A841SSB7_9BACL|nr:AraC family transcriptional regulator [Cohnella thailandensis]MBP1974625.1 AraC-like DNA-binding protein [Cohnella thailandensis]
MGVVRTGENRSLYNKLFLGIVLCTVVTLTLTSSILLIFFNRIALGQVYRSDLSTLTQTSSEVVSMTDSAQSLSFQIYRNLNVSKLMFYSDPNIYDTVAAMAELQNYLLSMTYIESIYVYNPKSEYMYISARQGQNGMIEKGELIDGEILTLLSHYKDYKPFTPIPRTLLVDADTGRKEAVYSYLCYDAIGSPKVVNSAVIVNIKAQWINKDIGNHSNGDMGKSFIIDNRGRLLSGDELIAGNLKEEARPILEKIISDPDSGYIVEKVNGEKSLISYTRPDALEWRYVRSTPYHLVTHEVRDIQRTTIGIAALILVGGLLLSWYLSRRLYVPIDRMANRMKMLEVEKRNSLYTVRQDFLRNLVHGREAINPKTLRARLATFGIGFDFNNEYRLVLLKIDRFKEFAESREADLRVYKYAILNISSELSSQAYPVETVDLEGDSVLLLLGAANSPEQADEIYLQSLLAQIQKAVEEHLRISVTIAYSELDNQVLHLHSMFKKVKEAAQYRMLKGHGALIKAQEVLVPPIKEYVYPEDREKKLVDAMMSGKLEEARCQYEQIIGEASRYPIPVLQSVITHLTLKLVSIMRIMQKNHNFEFEHNPEWAAPAMERFETLQEVDEFFGSVMSEIQEKLVEKRSLRHEDLIKRINDAIARHYSDPNLSLNWIAEELDMSPSYIGRIYKQITFKAIVDVINAVRMERSLELLQQTHYSVAEIAERCGFTNSSYFYRMFKKHFGLTPTDYRKTANQDEENGSDGAALGSGG